MATVDERIVSMKFENSQFESGARTSMGTLAKLKESMSFGSIVGGTVRALGVIDSAISKIGLRTPFAPFIRAANTALSGVGMVMDRLGMRNPFARASQGAADLQSAAAAAGGASGMGVLEGGVTAVSAKFVALSTIAITALSNITNRAINSATSFAKSFTFAPINDGLKEYELNLKSIQTIQANTDRPLPEINNALDQLNKYADQTIYNFGEMAKNIGTFTAAGVDLETSVSAIKGIANMAALSGSNSQQASTAMYQLSQALASGRVGLQDWNSVVNAGMGGKKLQNALAQTAIAMGDIDAAQVKGVKSGEQLTIMGKSFRESIMAQPGQESWMSSKILENALASLDGRYSVAALSQEKLADGTLKYKNRAEVLAAVEKARNAAAKDGIKYTDEQFEALQKLSTSAFESATKVKELGQVFDIAKETIASGWSASFRSIFGNLKEAKKLFTGMSEGLNGILEANALARNNMLASWKEQGGRDTLIEGLKNAWEALVKVGGAVRDAFRDVFPAMTAKRLVDITQAFADFTSNLIPGSKTLERISDIARGIFSVFSIVVTILKAAAGAIFGLLSTASSNSGGFLDFLASVGDSITKFDQFLKKSGLVEAFFSGLASVLSVPIALLGGLGKALYSVMEGISKGLNFAAFKGLSGDLDKAKGAGEKLKEFFGGLGDFFSKIGEKVGGAVASIGEAIADLFTPETFDRGLKALEVGLLAGLLLTIKKAFTKGVSVDLTGGLFDGIRETLGEATSAFKNMQQNLKADILIKIAIAIGIMALSLLVLSSIDPKALAKALGAMSAGFAALIGAMVAMMKFMGPAGIVAMYTVSSMMTKVALSILILAIALKILSNLKPGDIARGLVVLGAALYILQKAMIPLAAGSAGMVKAAAAMILMGVALNLIAVALKIFATMSWEELAKGLVGMAGALAGMVLAMKAMPKDMSVEAVTLIALAAAILILSVAVKIFATMSWAEIGRGLTALAGTLVAVAVALRLMPKKMLLQAVALNAVATAITILAGALKIMGSMSWEAIEKGLITLGISMLIMALGLQAMRGTLMGAAALVIAAQALAILIPVLVILGNLPIGVIITGLVALAATFAILGAAGYILAPVVVVIIGLAAALLLIGAAVALVGAGLWLMSAGFAAVVAAASMGMAVFAGIVQNVVLAIPKIAGAMAQGLLVFIASVAMAAPEIGLAFAKIVNAVLDQLILMVPKVGRLFSTVIATAIRVLVDAIPRFVTAGYRILAGVLKGLDDNIHQIVDRAISIVVKFINAVADNLDDIVEAGFNLIIKFIEGLTKAIEKNSEPLGEAAAELGIAIIEGVVSGLGSFGDAIKDKLMELAESAWNGVKDFFGVASPSRLMRDTVGKPIAQGMAVGIAAAAGDVDKEMTNMGKGAMNRLGETMKNIDDAVAIDPRMQPTVAPVLDLTALSKEANKIGGLLTTRPIRPRVSYSEASSLSAEISEAEREREEARERREAEPKNVTYEQHLHSPVPLDSVTIYRDSRSLIALKKEELFR